MKFLDNTFGGKDSRGKIVSTIANSERMVMKTRYQQHCNKLNLLRGCNK